MSAGLTASLGAAMYRKPAVHRALHVAEEGAPQAAAATKFSAANAPKYAVFSGGGQRGLAYLGALGALQQVHGIDLAKALCGAAGTSVGALFALFMVLKLSPSQASKEMKGTGFRDICSLNPGMLFTRYGMDDSERLRARLDDLLTRHTGLPKPVTLAQLYARTGRELVCVATDISTASPYYISARTEPDMPVSRAVAVSMSIPLVFCPFLHNGKVLVDGGLADGFPMHPSGRDAGLPRTVDQCMQHHGLCGQVLGARSLHYAFHSV